MSLIETPAKAISGAGSTVGSPVGSLMSAIKNPFKRSTHGYEPTVDYGEGFIIEEIDTFSKIILNGNMMPHDKFDREISLRKQKDFYPGSDDPVIHVFGYEENDITINGRLYDKKYKGKPDDFNDETDLPSGRDNFRGV